MRGDATAITRSWVAAASLPLISPLRGQLPPTGEAYSAEQILVVAHEIAHADHGEHIADIAQHAPKVQAQGTVRKLLAPLFERLHVHTALKILHLGLVELLECGAVLEQIVILCGNRACALADALDQPRGLCTRLKPSGSSSSTLFSKQG